MDLAQAARMIEWLDEERRRDRGIIASLEERLVQQELRSRCAPSFSS
jgi:hypothetical protein